MPPSRIAALIALTVPQDLYIGTAAWSLPKPVRDQFPPGDSQLAQYAQVLNATEINSTFSKTHRPDTFARWAAETPPDFRFSVKLPRAFTHDERLDVTPARIRDFFTSLQPLGERLAAALIQLPPSLAFDPKSAKKFLRAARAAFDGHVVLEPRHRSWFEDGDADQLLIDEHIGRVATDPARHPGEDKPGGWLGDAQDGRGALVYYRWHGSPRMYWSEYGDDWVEQQALHVMDWPEGTQRWCIFDNTASGAATADALRLLRLTDDDPSPTE